MSDSTRANPRRARRAFSILTLIAIAAAGSLSAALAAPASTITGLRVAGSGVVLLAAVGLAARVMIALDRPRRRRE